MDLFEGDPNRASGRCRLRTRRMKRTSLPSSSSRFPHRFLWPIALAAIFLLLQPSTAYASRNVLESTPLDTTAVTSDDTLIPSITATPQIPSTIATPQIPSTTSQEFGLTSDGSWTPLTTAGQNVAPLLANWLPTVTVTPLGNSESGNFYRPAQVPKTKWVAPPPPPTSYEWAPSPEWVPPYSGGSGKWDASMGKPYNVPQPAPTPSTSWGNSAPTVDPTTGYVINTKWPHGVLGSSESTLELIAGPNGLPSLSSLSSLPSYPSTTATSIPNPFGPMASLDPAATSTTGDFLSMMQSIMNGGGSYASSSNNPFAAALGANAYGSSGAATTSNGYSSPQSLYGMNIPTLASLMANAQASNAASAIAGASSGSGIMASNFASSMASNHPLLSSLINSVGSNGYGLGGSSLGGYGSSSNPSSASAWGLGSNGMGSGSAWNSLNNWNVPAGEAFLWREKSNKSIAF
uniref:Uncharacterized protein n=1 Tax=Polytomella parva TaxID=51329 RepID=A0A7S0YE39_9CHLO|mmetsp:Transcript_12853/g.22871  ORF Transcript_12853/g.22871 Transcript_12853/m.22871 type:complete len:462 (+) Transcript_12853:692-2077(+)